MLLLSLGCLIMNFRPTVTDVTTWANKLLRVPRGDVVDAHTWAAPCNHMDRPIEALAATFRVLCELYQYKLVHKPKDRGGWKYWSQAPNQLLYKRIGMATEWEGVVDWGDWIGRCRECSVRYVKNRVMEMYCSERCQQRAKKQRQRNRKQQWDLAAFESLTSTLT
jgi:hypothetical protein